LIKRPLFNKPKTPKLVPDQNLRHIHPVVKKMFQNLEIPQVPLAARLRYFSQAWENLTKDQEILSIIEEGYLIPFISEPKQIRVPKNPKVDREQKKLVQKEISEMLKKAAINVCKDQKDQFISTIFLVGKKDEGNRPVINLKQLNTSIPCQHFKMEGLHISNSCYSRGTTCASWI